MWIVVYRGELGDLFWNEEIRSWKMDRSAATRFDTAEEAMLSYREKSLMISPHIYVEEYSILSRLVYNIILTLLVLAVVILLITNGSKW